MASVAAIMIADYWVMTDGNVFMAWLYDPTSSNTHYYYCKGWKVQAYVTYIYDVALPFPGFVGSLGVNVKSAATHLSDLGLAISISVILVVYIALCFLWLTRNQSVVKKMGIEWEPTIDDGFIAPDGTVIVESDDAVLDAEPTKNIPQSTDHTY